MVLQLSTSPFASRTASSSTAVNSSQKPQLTSTTSSSHSSHLSFLSERAKVLQHGRSKRSSSLSSSSSPSWMSTFTAPKNKSVTRSRPQSSRTDSGDGLWFKIAFRLLGISSGLFSIVIVPTLKDSGLKHGFGRGTQYLTILSLFLTMINLALGIIGDVMNNQRLLKIKDAMLPVIVPGECAVAVLYWYLTLSNVYHIYPDGNRYIPMWIDIQMHGIPALFAFVEMFYFSKTFQVKRAADFCVISLFALFYMGWSSFCAHMDGEWPYPILQNLTCPWERLQMMLTSYLVYVALHFVISETHIRSRAARKLEHVIESTKESL